MRRAAAAFAECRVAIGMKLLPVGTPLIEKLTSILDYFARLPSGAQTAIVAIAGIGAAIGPVLIGVGKLVAAFGPLFTVLTAQLAPAFLALRLEVVALATVSGPAAAAARGLTLALKGLLVASVVGAAVDRRGTRLN